jgi:NDP-sugar pyrophosphorylase family protein
VIRIAKGLLILGLSLPAIVVVRAEEGAGPVYELRTYTTREGRLPALQARFRNHTMRLFEKHGIRNVGYWIPVDRPNTLIYLIAHASRDAVEGNWRSFAGDPEWQEVARESQKDGPILVEGGIQSQLMTATDYSPIR